MNTDTPHPLSEPTSVLTEDKVERYTKAGWEVRTSMISMTDRPEWEMWECIREIVQNALDATESFSIMVVPHMGESSLLIKDTGKGLYITDLLIGKVRGEQKPPWARGRFGEGLKFGCLAGLREGYKIHILSGGPEDVASLEIIPFQYKRFLKDPRKVTGGQEVEELSFFYRGIPPKKSEGTEVYIIGYQTPTYTDRFNLDNPPLCTEPVRLVDQPLDIEREDGVYDCWVDGERALFSRNIYIQPIEDALFSYDLFDIELSRERNAPQSLYDVQRLMGKLLSGCPHPEVVEVLFKAIVETADSTAYEALYANPSWKPRNDETRDAWMKLWRETYAGAKVVLFTNEGCAESAKWQGYKVLKVAQKWMDFCTSIFPTDCSVAGGKIVQSHIPPDQLEPVQWLNLSLTGMLSFFLIMTHHFHLNITPCFAMVVNPEEDVAGAYLSKTELDERNAPAVNRDILPHHIIGFNLELLSDSPQRVIDVMIHELGHLVTGGAVDRSNELIHAISQVGAEVTDIMVDHMEIREAYAGIKLLHSLWAKEKHIDPGVLSSVKGLLYGIKAKWWDPVPGPFNFF